VDPDPDPGGPKTCGSGRSGSGSGSGTQQKLLRYSGNGSIILVLESFRFSFKKLHVFLFSVCETVLIFRHSEYVNVFDIEKKIL
jgi:hypothetical protein